MKRIILLTLLVLSIYGSSIAQAPTANFKADITGGCSPIVVKFQDLSSANATSWYWDFGNGATSILQNPSATYFAPGTYTVFLTATNASGSNTISKPAYITVYDVPKIDFGHNKSLGCTPLTVQFADLSTASAGTSIANWQWSFGDGTQSAVKNPVVTYRTPGSYSVSLKITNDKGCSQTMVKPDIIQVTPGITSGFQVSDPSSCNAPASVQFTNNTSAPGQVQHTWSFGDGEISFDRSPSHTYKAVGKYTVSLVTNSSIGCTDTLRKDTVVVIGGFNSDFTVPKICENSEVLFANNSSAGLVSSLWKFPGGNTSVSTNPTISFPAAGTYDVTLVNTYSFCKDTVTKSVTVLPKPKLDFTADNLTSCQGPLTVHFQNLSTGATDASYQWNFEENNTSTEKNPQYTFTKNGNFSIKLKGTSEEGCADSITKSDFIKITRPVISFSGLPEKGCIPYSFSPKVTVNTPDNVVSYDWDFGDGTKGYGPVPNHTYAQQGTYDITLTITTSTGCTEIKKFPQAVMVGTLPQAGFVADKLDVCASMAINFTNQSSTPTDTYFWNFGDGGTSILKNPGHEYSDTGYMDVRLIAINNGCPDTLTIEKYIHIKPPIAKFTFRPNCDKDKRLEFSFENKSVVDPNAPQNWEWDFGDGSPKVNSRNPAPHLYPDWGTYPVSLVINSGECSFTYKETIKVVDQTPDFTASDRLGCRIFNTVFAGQSPVTIVSYNWQFGDGTSAKGGANQPHTYNQAGDYDVKLVTTDIYGCLDSVIKPKYIRVNGPEAAFVSINNQGCRGMTASFEDKSLTDGQNAIVSWKWNFGDGTTATSASLKTMQHKYDSVGQFTVKLVVEDASGCQATASYANHVHVSSPKAKWDVSRQTCPGAFLNFKNSTAGNYTSAWDFGDGTTSYDNFPAHAYTDTGYYTVKLTITDDKGCQDTLVREKYVYNGKPVANFTANNFVSYCPPFEARFTNTSNYYLSWKWDLGNGSPAQQKDPSTFYISKGVYDVKLIVTSPGGCQDAVTKQVTVYDNYEGKLNYSYNSGCTPVPVSFEAFSDMNAKFTWDFGNGVVIKDTSVSALTHVYKDFGSFIPRIIMRDPWSPACPFITIVGKDTIHVLGVKANFGVNKQFFCDSATVRITDSTATNDRIANYTWDFGDGKTSSKALKYLEQIDHYYSGPGNYSVFLKVQTKEGCTDSLRTPIKIALSPDIKIAADSVICINGKITYTGVVLRRDTSELRWSWSFPNGNTAAVQNPQVQQYTRAGKFEITAVATSNSGCSDKATKSLLVNPNPVVSMPSVITMMAGSPVTIPATYSSNIMRYSWTPNDRSLSCVDCPQPVTVNTKSDTRYRVSVVDSNGCKNAGEIQVFIICKNANVFLPNTFSPNGDGSNDIFRVQGRGIDRVKSLRVFNRWGEVVFEKREYTLNDPAGGWDGRYKGNKPKPDVYVYQVETYCDNGDIIHFEGNVSLIL